MYAEYDGRSSLITGLDDIQDSLSTATMHGHGVRLPEGMTEETAVRIYDNYNLHHRYDERLPITRYRQDVSQSVSQLLLLLVLHVCMYDEDHWCTWCSSLLFWL